MKIIWSRYKQTVQSNCTDPDLDETQIAYWRNNLFAVSANVIFICMVTVLLIPKLFNGLQRAFDNKNRIEEELKLNKAELKKSLIQLEEKNRELVDFAYIVSHDLKEPLRMIQSSISFTKVFL